MATATDDTAAQFQGWYFIFLAHQKHSADELYRTNFSDHV